MSDDKKPRESILGKYRETSTEIYADSLTNFGGTYSGDDIRKIRMAGYSQGFYDCEMAEGPDPALLKSQAMLKLAKEALEEVSAYHKEGQSRSRPRFKVAKEALAQIEEMENQE